jgi:hypothetical protein
MPRYGEGVGSRGCQGVVVALARFVRWRLGRCDHCHRAKEEHQRDGERQNKAAESRSPEGFLEWKSHEQFPFIAANVPQPAAEGKALKYPETGLLSELAPLRLRG